MVILTAFGLVLISCKGKALAPVPTVTLRPGAPGIGMVTISAEAKADTTRSSAAKSFFISLDF